MRHLSVSQHGLQSLVYDQEKDYYLKINCEYKSMAKKNLSPNFFHLLIMNKEIQQEKGNILRFTFLIEKIWNIALMFHKVTENWLF